MLLSLNYFHGISQDRKNLKTERKKELFNAFFFFFLVFRIYQSMSQSLGLSYMRWENDNKETTVFHESILQQFSHVPEDVKKEIRNANERPHWISGQGGLAAEKYWINQDTNVDIPAIRKLVERSLYNSALNSELLRKATGKDEL